MNVDNVCVFAYVYRPVSVLSLYEVATQFDGKCMYLCRPWYASSTPPYIEMTIVPLNTDMPEWNGIFLKSLTLNFNGGL